VTALIDFQMIGNDHNAFIALLYVMEIYPVQ